MVTLQEIRAAMGGTITGRQVLCPGPGHSARDRSLAVKPSPTARLGFIVVSHAGDDWRDCRSYVATRLGIDEREPERTWQSPIEAMQRAAQRAQAEREEAAERDRRKRRALDLWQHAVEPRGTVVERYLASRSLDLSAEIAGSVLRFHPACPWRNDAGDLCRVPAMVALMRDVVTDEPVAIHRTALTSDGQKVGRKMLGPVAGAAIKLDAAENVTIALTIGEGIESALSARQLGFAPVWAMGSVGEIDRLPVLAGIEVLSLLEERDESGASGRAVQRCSARWRAAGREVLAVLPRFGGDMNDALARMADAR